MAARIGWGVKPASRRKRGGLSQESRPSPWGDSARGDPLTGTSPLSKRNRPGAHPSRLVSSCESGVLGRVRPPTKRSPKSGSFGLCHRRGVKLTARWLHNRSVILLVKGEVVDLLAGSPRDVALDAGVVAEWKALLHLDS